jgi:hypothetical protein
MSFIVLQNKSIISPASYLKTARKLAEIHGYEPDMLTFSKNPSKKLSYNNVDFGSSSNNDYIIYKSMERIGLIGLGEAEKHRKRYLARASKIKGNWKSNPISKNNLSMKILWNGS